MAEAEPSVIGYATAPREGPLTRTFRRLVWANLICGALMIVQLPATFAGAFLFVWYGPAKAKRPPTWNDFLRILGPHPWDLVPSAAWYAVAGSPASDSGPGSR